MLRYTTSKHPQGTPASHVTLSVPSGREYKVHFCARDDVASAVRTCTARSGDKTLVCRLFNGEKAFAEVEYRESADGRSAYAVLKGGFKLRPGATALGRHQPCPGAPQPAPARRVG